MPLYNWMVHCFDDVTFLILRIQSGVAFQSMVSKRRQFRAYEVHFTWCVIIGMDWEKTFCYLFFQECFINKIVRPTWWRTSSHWHVWEYKNLNMSAMMDISLRFMEIGRKIIVLIYDVSVQASIPLIIQLWMMSWKPKIDENWFSHLVGQLWILISEGKIVLKIIRKTKTLFALFITRYFSFTKIHCRSHEVIQYSINWWNRMI